MNCKLQFECLQNKQQSPGKFSVVRKSIYFLKEKVNGQDCFVYHCGFSWIFSFTYIQYTTLSTQDLILCQEIHRFFYFISLKTTSIFLVCYHPCLLYLGFRRKQEILNFIVFKMKSSISLYIVWVMIVLFLTELTFQLPSPTGSWLGLVTWQARKKLTQMKTFSCRFPPPFLKSRLTSQLNSQLGNISVRQKRPCSQSSNSATRIVCRHYSWF